MKKLMLATLAIAAFATTSNAQLTSWNNISYNNRAMDQSTMQITVNVPNVLILSPNSGGPISANAVFTPSGNGGSFGTTTIGSQTWTVWSNREYFVYYNVPANFSYTNTTSAYNDGDESTTMPIGMLQFRVSGNNTLGAVQSPYGSYTSAVHATASVWASNANHAEGTSNGTNSLVSTQGQGTELIDEGQVGQRTFTTDFQLSDPSYNYVGGQYTATFTIWAIQE